MSVSDFFLNIINTSESERNHKNQIKKNSKIIHAKITKSETIKNQQLTEIQSGRINHFKINESSKVVHIKNTKSETIKNQLSYQQFKESLSNQSERDQLNFSIRNPSQPPQFLKRLIILNSTILNQKRLLSDKFSKDPVLLIQRLRHFHFFSQTRNVSKHVKSKSNSKKSKQIQHFFSNKFVHNFPTSEHFSQEFSFVFDEFNENRQNNNNENQIEKNYTSKKNLISKTQISDNSTMNQQFTSQMKVIIDQIIERAVNKVLSDIQTNSSDSSDSQNSADNEGFSNLQNSQNSAKKIEITMNKSDRWNFENIGFFDSNFENKSAITDELLIHSNKDTYYKNVHVFVKRVKEMTIVLKTNVVKKNLSSCLRDTIFM